MNELYKISDDVKKQKVTILIYRYYVGHIYAVYLPSTAAATPSAAAEKPRANDNNLPSYLTIIINMHFQRIFNNIDKEDYSANSSF